MEKNLDIQAECRRFASELASWVPDDANQLPHVADMIHCITRRLSDHTCWIETAEAIAKALDEMRTAKVRYERDESGRQTDHDELSKAATLLRSMPI